MINTSILMGRLTADPELKTTSGGVPVIRFTIAVERRFTKAGEEKQADFINIVAWRQAAEFVSRYFYKGSLIAVRGSIQTSRYEDNEGNKRTNFEVVADEISFCGSSQQNGTGTPQADNGRAKKNSPAAGENTRTNRSRTGESGATVKNARTSRGQQQNSAAYNNSSNYYGYDDEPPYGY